MQVHVQARVWSRKQVLSKFLRAIESYSLRAIELKIKGVILPIEDQDEW